MLTRDFLQRGGLQDLVRRKDPAAYVLSDAELRQSLDGILADWPPGEDIWVFGYGSLIWNPAFHFSESRLGTVHGYHRDFCLWVYLGRGTREQPGLMLGLKEGGSTTGLCLRIPADQVEEELSIIWRREMVTASYVPRWVTMETDEGPVRGIAFTIDPAGARYADGLTIDQIVDHIATGVGEIGTSAEYLLSTTDHLVELGIHDQHLLDLAERVKAKMRDSAGHD